jgi:hypothetical protein
MKAILSASSADSHVSSSCSWHETFRPRMYMVRSAMAHTGSVMARSNRYVSVSSTMSQAWGASFMASADCYMRTWCSHHILAKSSKHWDEMPLEEARVVVVNRD